MRPFWITWAFAGAAFLIAADPKQKETEQPMTVDQALAVLRTSEKRDELERAAIRLVQSKEKNAQEALAKFLQDPKFLRRLDTDDDYKFYHSRLRIGHLMQAIGKASTPNTQEILLQLGNNKDFASNLARMDALIEAMGNIHAPSKNLLAFLDARLIPQGPFTTGIISALVAMRSPGASMLVEKRMLSPRFSISSKIGWLTMDLLTVRTDPAIVGLYKNLLDAKIKDASLRNTVVQTLFEHRVLKWYPPARTYPMPPKWQDASTAVLQELVKLADKALKLDITPDTKEGAIKAKKEIEAILKERKAKK